MTPVAIQSCIYSLSDMSTPGISALISSTGTPSANFKVLGIGVLKNNFSLSISAITCATAGATIPDPGPYTANFISGATKLKNNGDLVLLEGDKTGIISASPQIPGTPPVPFPVTFKVTISSANQTKLKAI